MAFTKIKDVDIHILNKLNDYELGRVCQVNTYARELCKREELWMQRFDSKYGKIMGNLQSVKKQFDVTNWEKFYKNFVHKLYRFDTYHLQNDNFMVESDDYFYANLLKNPVMMKYITVLVRTNPLYKRAYSMDFRNPNRWEYFFTLIDELTPEVHKSWEILNQEIFMKPAHEHIY